MTSNNNPLPGNQGNTGNPIQKDGGNLFGNNGLNSNPIFAGFKPNLNLTNPFNANTNVPSGQATNAFQNTNSTTQPIGLSGLGNNNQQGGNNTIPTFGTGGMFNLKNQSDQQTINQAEIKPNNGLLSNATFNTGNNNNPSSGLFGAKINQIGSQLSFGPTNTNSNPNQNANTNTNQTTDQTSTQQNTTEIKANPTSTFTFNTNLISGSSTDTTTNNILGTKPENKPNFGIFGNNQSENKSLFGNKDQSSSNTNNPTEQKGLFNAPVDQLKENPLSKALFNTNPSSSNNPIVQSTTSSANPSLFGGEKTVGTTKPTSLFNATTGTTNETKPVTSSNPAFNINNTNFIGLKPKEGEKPSEVKEEPKQPEPSFNPSGGFLNKPQTTTLDTKSAFSSINKPADNKPIIKPEEKPKESKPIVINNPVVNEPERKGNIYKLTYRNYYYTCLKNDSRFTETR